MIPGFEQTERQLGALTVRGDLISRQEVLNTLENEWDGMVLHVFDVIRQVPPAEPDVIRCKDCKYCRKEDEYEYWCYGFCSPARLVRKEDFCSYGCKYE